MFKQTIAAKSAELGGSPHQQNAQKIPLGASIFLTIKINGLRLAASLLKGRTESVNKGVTRPKKTYRKCRHKIHLLLKKEPRILKKIEPNENEKRNHDTAE